MIQPATPDHTEILSLIQLTTSQEVFTPITGNDYLTPSKIKQRNEIWHNILVNKQEYAYLYSIDNEYIGFGSYKLGYHKNVTGAEICSLYVLKNRWGKGIGKELLTWITSQIMLDPQVTDIFLWTYEANTRTTRFYEKNGFAVTTNFVVRNNKPKVVEMTKNIKRITGW